LKWRGMEQCADACFHLESAGINVGMPQRAPEHYFASACLCRAAAIFC
jgi:hypothetical protein